jgi:tRNA A-37 threonylcarbamoyl transferase component Bud32
MEIGVAGYRTGLGRKPDKRRCYVRTMFVCSECGAPQPAEGWCPVDGTPLAPRGEEVLLGTTIGAYRVARLLGVGGMGRVYKGVHPAIGSRVAIKVLSRECTDRRELVDRFFAEAKAVNLIRHESIVNVLDLATLPDGRPYIIMEYLDGAPLASIIEHAVQTRSPLPLGGLARLAVEVLDALAAAHAKGIVHRDLKPDNIYVTPSGRPKVLDFGIAKLSDLNAGSATRTGSLLGTPHYMAPEQAAGKPVDLRADVYAIGVILFEAATGQKPFLAESLFELLRKHVEVPPPPPRGLRPDLPVEVESVILTALAKAPEHRFASAQAMSMALQHATAHLAAEQWVPITGTGVHRGMPSGGWQPTPPASWGGAARARESVQPLGGTAGPEQRASQDRAWAELYGNRSTVSGSSGQVQRQRQQQVQPQQVQQQERQQERQRRGLWIGLGAVALVGGVVAVVATRGGGGGGGGGPAGSAAASAVDPVGSARPEQGKAAGGAGGAGGGEVDDADDAAGEQRALEATLKGLEAMDPGKLPAGARKQLEAMKQLAKLPPKERLAKLKQMRGASQDLTGGLAEAVEAIEAIDATDGGGGGAGTPRPGASSAAPSSAPPGAWVTARELAFAGFDPKRLDVSAFIRWAIAEAKQADPGAVLFRVDVSGVGPDGFANLELPTLASGHGSLDLRFFSPARAKRNPSLPLGVPEQGKTCEFRIEAEPDGVQLRPISGFDCKRNVAVPAPRCTAAALWKRALAAKAPQNAVASLGYRAWSGRFRWGFDIGFGHDRVFSQVFDDDC